MLGDIVQHDGDRSKRFEDGVTMPRIIVLSCCVFPMVLGAIFIAIGRKGSANEVQ